MIVTIAVECAVSQCVTVNFIVRLALPLAKLSGFVCHSWNEYANGLLGLFVCINYYLVI